MKPTKETLKPGSPVRVMNEKNKYFGRCGLIYKASEDQKTFIIGDIEFKRKDLELISVDEFRMEENKLTEIADEFQVSDKIKGKDKEEAKKIIKAEAIKFFVPELLARLPIGSTVQVIFYNPKRGSFVLNANEKRGVFFTKFKPTSNIPDMISGRFSGKRSGVAEEMMRDIFKNMPRLENFSIGFCPLNDDKITTRKIETTYQLSENRKGYPNTTITAKLNHDSNSLSLTSKGRGGDFVFKNSDPRIVASIGRLLVKASLLVESKK